MANVSNIPVKLKDENPNYLISIFGTDETGQPVGTGTGMSPYLGILSPMPEEFSIDVASSWHSILDGVLKASIATFLGNNAATAIGTIAALTGYNLATVATSQLVWESTSPITFNLPLKFNAVHDVAEEVTQPILKLLSLVLPSTNDTGYTTLDNNLPLLAPGPSSIGKYAVHVAIGNMFIFENIIVNSVTAQFSTLSDSSGGFLYADVNVGITTSRIMTKKSLAKAFQQAGKFGTFNSESSGGL